MSTPNAQDKAAQLRREECRHLVMEYLVLRRSLSFREDAICRGVNREYGADYTQTEVSEELDFLCRFKPPYIESAPSARTAVTKVYQVTPDGILAFEGGQA